jgi:hypothetical protein
MRGALVIAGLLAGGAAVGAILLGSLLARPWSFPTNPSPWLQPILTLVGSAAGVLLGFVLNRWHERRLARRRYVALLTACQSDLANAYAVAMRIEDQVSDKGTLVLELDAPGVFALLADATFYNEGTYGFMVVARGVASLVATSRNVLEQLRQPSVSLTAEGVQDVRTRMKQLCQGIAKLQGLIDGEMRRLGFALLRTPEDQAAIEGFRTAIHNP